MTSRSLLSTLLASTIIATAASAEDVTRVVTVPVGGEITGMFIYGDDLFFNVQHPDDTIPTEFSKATVGVVSDFNLAGEALSVPTEDADKQIVRTSLGEYQVLFQEGAFDQVGIISGADGGSEQSNDPDFNAFVPTGENEGYLFTNWEDRPGGMSRVMLTRAEDGTWTADGSDATMIDFSKVGGTWVNCFGTLSPWGTPLSSEELYFDDTAQWNDPSYEDISDVEGLASYLGEYPNPYRYGYIVEITDPKHTATPVKAFALGRFSHENAVVMPDQRTVYLSDDGTDVVLFKFIADQPGDLSAGRLFAAQVDQMGEDGADSAKTELQVNWIELAHGTNEEIETWIAQYDGITQDDKAEGETNYISDEEIAAWARGDADDNRVAFLETRKAAKAKGATAEFRKMEGVNINYDGAADGSVPYMYLAISEVGKGMSDAEGDLRLSENKCGMVYEMKLDANFNVARMTPVVAGGAYDAEAESCDVDAMANPDNLVVLSGGDVLIGEDTSLHENNAMWLYQPARGSM